METKGIDNLRRIHRCGQCANCRITRNQEWALRIQLEAKLHPHSLFVTLTYDPEHVPEGYSLCKRHLQLFHKRLRRSGLRFRFFSVGEYGGKFKRPHYHGIYFGLGPDHEEQIARQWGGGFVKVDELTMGRASYAAKYCLKKATHPDYYEGKKEPEFALMSRKPGIGIPYLEKIADTYRTSKLYKLDVPTTIRLDGKTWPIDAYLRTCLRKTGVFRVPTTLQSDLKTNHLAETRLKALEYEQTNERQEYENRDKIARIQNRTVANRVLTPTANSCDRPYAVDPFQAGKPVDPKTILRET